MTARRHAILAAVAVVLAVLLWWLSRDVVAVPAPPVDPPVEGLIERTRTTTWLLLSATVSAGLAMVFATLAILNTRPGGNG